MRRQPWEYASIVSIMDGEERILKLWRTDEWGPLPHLIYRCAQDLAQCEEDLLRSAARIEDSLEAMKAHLAVGHHINELGILQREPAKLDALAAKRQMLIDQMKSLLWANKEGNK